MNCENLLDEIQKIQFKLDAIKSEIQKEKIKESLKTTDHIQKQNYLESANLMRQAFSLFKEGLNAWEVAERLKGAFPSVWDAYYFISKEKHQENIRYQYARAYLVHTLAKKTDLPYAEIGKIAGYSKGRVSQIAHSFKNSSSTPSSTAFQ